MARRLEVHPTRRLLITGRNQVLLHEVRGFVDGLLGLRLDGLKDHGPIDACEIVFDWVYGSSDEDDDIEITRALGRWIRRCGSKLAAGMTWR